MYRLACTRNSYDDHSAFLRLLFVHKPQKSRRFNELQDLCDSVLNLKAESE